LRFVELSFGCIIHTSADHYLIKQTRTIKGANHRAESSEIFFFCVLVIKIVLPEIELFENLP